MLAWKARLGIGLVALTSLFGVVVVVFLASSLSLDWVWTPWGFLLLGVGGFYLLNLGEYEILSSFD